MSEPSQAERIAALKAKRAEMPAQTVPEPAVVEPAAEPRWRRPSRPATQRVAAAGASIVSFAAMTAAMGPLTAPAQETATAGVSPDAVPADEPTTIAPPETPEVHIEVVPNYVAVSADGTPLPDVALSADGTLADGSSGANTSALGFAAAEPDSTTAPMTTAASAPTTAAATATPAAAPAQPAATTTASPTTAPATTAAPAPAAAPAPTTAAPAPTTAAPPPTTAAPPATQPPPPKSDASG